MKSKKIFVLFFLGIILFFAQKDIENFGSESIVHRKTNTTYIEESYKKTHTKNVVTAVLADWRSTDTFGETMVIFVAGIGILLILGTKKIR
tara:strand:+ start:445 stop:717 length:273 start_codon:yes stop_codon:yes gene_type:complete